MATTNIFEKLTELQEILVKKYDLETKIAEAPRNLGSQEELLSRLKKEYITKNSDYEAVKDKISQLRFELNEAIKSREEGEKGMDNIQTHREYEALGKQINEATIKENEVRKDLQHEEKSLQALDESLKNYEDMIKAQENDLALARQNIESEVSAYNAELGKLEENENVITESINDQELLFKFKRIIQRNAEGIVAVKNGVCTGCHMILPAQFANTVQEFTESANNENSETEGKEIPFCPYCSRILKYEESDEDSTESYFRIEDAGSLTDLDDEFADEYDEDEDEEREEDLYDKANKFVGESGDIDDEDDDSYDDEDDDDSYDDDEDD